MTDRSKLLQLQTQLRRAKQNGPASSADLNDLIDEIIADLTSMYDQWNTTLVPLVATLPNGTAETAVDAFLNGLEGDSIFLDKDATEQTNASYYNASKGRPNTVLEQFVDAYSTISELQEALDEELSTIEVTAADVPIEDTDELIAATNVETALAELATDIAALEAGTAIDFTAIESNVVATEAGYDLGTTSNPWGDLYLASGLHLPTGGSGSAPLIELGGAGSGDGIYHSGVGFLDFASGGIAAFNMDASRFQGVESNSASLRNTTSDENTPVFTSIDDDATGLGFPSVSEYTLTVSGVETVRGSPDRTTYKHQVLSQQQATLTPAGTTQTIDWDNGNSVILDLEDASGDVTLTLNNPQAGASYVIEIRQDSSTARNITWPAEVTWAGGSAPTISTGNDAIDVVSLHYNGTTYRANIGQDYS